MDLPLQNLSIASTSYPSTPQVDVSDVGADVSSWLITNQSSDPLDMVFISWDGFEDHGVLVPGLVQSLTYTKKRTKLWLRLDAGAANPTSCFVMADDGR